MISESIDRLNRWHRVLRRKTEKGMTSEVLAEVRSFINYCRNTGRFEYDLEDREYLRSLLRQWGGFIVQHSEDAEYLDLSLLPFEEELAVGKERKAISFAVGWKRISAVVKVAGVLLAIIVGLIFVTWVYHIEEWRDETRATPTPIVVIHRIARIEVFMNGGQLTLDRLPSLTSGQAVELEVFVVDTNGQRYASDDLGCKWSVAPLGNYDKGIDADLCKVFYTPSQEYSQQTVVVEVEGLEQQFRPGDPVLMKFDIK